MVGSGKVPDLPAGCLRSCSGRCDAALCFFKHFKGSGPVCNRMLALQMLGHALNVTFSLMPHMFQQACNGPDSCGNKQGNGKNQGDTSASVGHLTGI